MNKIKLSLLAILLVTCFSWATLSAGEPAPKTGEGGEKAGAPETPEEEEARLKRYFSRYVVICIDIEETITEYKAQAKEFNDMRVQIVFAFNLTTGRYYKGAKYDDRRAKMNVKDVKNPHLYVIKEGSAKPRRSKKDKKQYFTTEEAKKYADYILSGKISIDERAPSEFFGTHVACGFNGELELELIRTKDKKAVWSDEDKNDFSMSDRGGGKPAAIQLVQYTFLKKYLPILVKLPEWEKAKEIIPKIPYGVIKTDKSEGVIFPKSAAESLVAGQLKSVKKSWTPKEKDIKKLEAKLEQYLMGNPPEKAPKLHEKLSEYKRQYTGITVEKKKRIYVNLFRDPKGKHKNWKRRPVIVDGGGADYFEIQYDIKSGEFSDLHVHDKK
ncbi:MAG: hypothetical protein E3J72_04190 [Planctomycetota bacterium]|nr:MAG: hypothetical protein E3J72_04190 [Planctomycetota bacterium]